MAPKKQKKIGERLEVGSMLDNVSAIEGCVYQGTTNIRKLKKVLFSLKKRKFVKPYRRYGDSMSGSYEYGVLPGTYLSFSVYWWSKGEPPMSLEIELVKVEGSSMEIVKKVKFEVSKKSEILELLKGLGFEKCSAVIEDFMGYMPGYHSRPDIKALAEKVYDEEEVKGLEGLLEKYNGKTFYSGLEVE